MVKLLEVISITTYVKTVFFKSTNVLARPRENVGLDKFVDMYRLSTVSMQQTLHATSSLANNYRFISLIPLVAYLVQNPTVA